MTKFYIIPTKYFFDRQLSYFGILATAFGYESLASGHDRNSMRQDLLSVFNHMSGLKVDTKLPNRVRWLHRIDYDFVLTSNIDDARKYCYERASRISSLGVVNESLGVVKESFAIFECSLEEEEAQLVKEIKIYDEILYKLKKPLLGVTDQKEFFKKIKLENAELINIIGSYKPPLRYEFPKLSLWSRFKDFINHATTSISDWFKSPKTHSSSSNSAINAPVFAPYPPMLFKEERCPSGEHASDGSCPSGEHTSDGPHRPKPK